MSNSYGAAAAEAPVTSARYRKPMPRPDAWSKVFWQGTRDHVFLAQRDEEGNIWFPPGPVSPFTRTTKWQWMPLSGRGTVVSWVVFHQNYFPGFDEELPYNVTLVQLDEGPRIFTNMVDIANSEIRIGMRVTVCFREVSSELALPVFRPLAGEQA